MVKKRGSKHKAVNRRAGRTLKMASRKPCGRLTQTSDVVAREDMRRVVREQREKHLGLPPERSLSTYAATPHGVMLEKGRITKAQYEVCERYAEMHHRYALTMGGPALTSGARCYGEQPGSMGIEDEEKALAARRAYLAVCALFEDRVLLHNAARDVVLRGIWPQPAGWKVFTRALEMLAEHWGMEG